MGDGECAHMSRGWSSGQGGVNPLLPRWGADIECLILKKNKICSLEIRQPEMEKKKNEIRKLIPSESGTTVFPSKEQEVLFQIMLICK